MRKAIVLAVTALMALTLVGCGGGNDIESAATAADPLVSGTAGLNSGGSGADDADAGKSDAAAAGKPDAQAAVNTPDSSNTSSGSTAPNPEHEAGPWNIPQKTYAAYDRFSGDKLESPTLTVLGVWADRIEFDYTRNDGAWTGVSVNLDSSGRGSVQIDGITLEVALGDGTISVDEIEGMGAMAYVFR